MALADKMKYLAERVDAIPKKLEGTVDAQLARLDKVDERGAEATRRLQGFVDGVEQGVAVLEDTLNQLTNNPPKV